MSRPGVRCWAYVWPVFLSSPGEGGAGLLASSSKAQRHSLSESALGHRSLLNQAPRPGRENVRPGQRLIHHFWPWGENPASLHPPGCSVGVGAGEEKGPATTKPHGLRQVALLPGLVSLMPNEGLNDIIMSSELFLCV